MKKALVMALAALLMTGMASCNSNTSSSESTEETTPDYGQQIKDNKTLGREFMEQNAQNDSVVQTKSGMQYIVVKEGNGAKPGPEDTVTVHYTGKLIDGTVFDSSVERGEPATFAVGQVIPGWDEGVQLMSKGEKGLLYIPYYLAYGERDMGDIPPFSNLIFEVELIDFETFE
jgi:FKBP-type peptidyl-prolyl cis-trans isomerase